jgi:DeoR family fructose operon transcriptional repressor
VEKDLVCRKAASFVQDGSCVFLDGGSSIVPMVKYLKNRQVKIVTNNLMVAGELIDAQAEVFFVGGNFIPKYGMNAGPLAIEEIARFNFDYSFISCLGLDLDRQLIYTSELDTMAVKAAAMRVSTSNVLLLDSSKLYIKAFCSLISSSAFDFMICNNDSSLVQENLPANFLLVDVD